MRARSWGVVWLTALLSAGCLAHPHRVFDAKTGWRAEFVDDLSPQYMLFSRKGKLLLVQSTRGGHDDRHAVRVFDGRTLMMLWQLQARHARFDATGDYVVALADRWKGERVEVRRARSGSLVFGIRHKGHFAFSRQGKLALARDDRIDIIDIRRRKTVQTLKTRGHVYGLQLSVDGGRLAYIMVIRGFNPRLVCPPKGRGQVRWSKEIPRPRKGVVHECYDQYYQSLVRVVDLRSGRVLCSAAVDRSALPHPRTPRMASPDLKYLALAATEGALLVHVDRCWPVAHVPGQGVFLDAPRLWAGIGDSAIHVLDLAKGVWRAAIRWPRPRYSSSAVASNLSHVAVLKSIRGVPSLWTRPLARPRWYPPPARRQPFRWMAYNRPSKASIKGPEQSWPGAVAQSLDTTVELRARLTHTGVVLQITNRSLRTIEVDWRRTYLASQAGRRMDTVALNRPYTHRCTTGPVDRNPMRLAPGVRHVEELATLRQRSHRKIRMDALDPTPVCGQRTTLHVGLITDGSRCQQRRLTFAGICPSTGSQSKKGPHPVFLFHPMIRAPVPAQR